MEVNRDHVLLTDDGHCRMWLTFDVDAHILHHYPARCHCTLKGEKIQYFSNFVYCYQIKYAA